MNEIKMSKKDWKKNPFATLTRNFGNKTDRTDTLDETLQNVSRQIDQMEQACHDVSKKLNLCLRTKGMEGEKRFQKLPEWLLGQTMISSSKLTPHLLGGVLGVCGSLHLELASLTVTSEDQMEQASVLPLQNFEKDLLNLHKTRKQFDKLTKDLESAKSKFNAAKQSKSDVPESKLSICLQELDEAEQKLEQCRVQYSTELYSILPREADLSNSVMQLMNVQAQYYRNCLELIDKALLEAKKKIQESEKGCVFGRSLEDHLKSSSRDVAFVLEECITFLMPHLDEEGLFRIAGGAGQVKLIKAALDAGSPLSTVEVRDVHCVASLLKQYLRELPEPLLSFALYDQWVQAMNASSDQRVDIIKATCEKLPVRIRENLRFLLQFLREFAQHSARSKMTTMNIGVVIGPCLLWAPPNSSDGSSGVGHVNALVETLINNFDQIFPDGSNINKDACKTRINDDLPLIDEHNEVDKSSEYTAASKEVVTEATVQPINGRNHSVKLTNEELKFEPTATTLPVLRPAPPPPAAFVPKNIHSEMYSTAFMLQSLGDEGSASSYLSRVRTLWDGHLGSASPSGENASEQLENNTTFTPKAKGHSRGSSAGSGSTFATSTKSYADVADWVSKAQSAVVDSNDDDSVSPRNARKPRKQAPMPPAPAPPGSILSDNVSTISRTSDELNSNRSVAISANINNGKVDEHPSKIASLSRGIRPERPEKPTKPDRPISEMKLIAPKAELDEFDAGDNEMVKSFEKIVETNEVGVEENEKGGRFAREVSVNDKPGKPPKPDKPDVSSQRGRLSITSSANKLETLESAVTNDDKTAKTKTVAIKPERPEKPNVDYSQVTSEVAIDNNKIKSQIKPERPEKPMLDNTAMQSQMKPERPEKPALDSTVVQSQPKPERPEKPALDSTALQSDSLLDEKNAKIKPAAKPERPEKPHRLNNKGEKSESIEGKFDSLPGSTKTESASQQAVKSDVKIDNKMESHVESNVASRLVKDEEKLASKSPAASGSRPPRPAPPPLPLTSSKESADTSFKPMSPSESTHL